MKIYLINLDRAAGRLKEMQRVFGAINQSFERVPGVDAASFGEGRRFCTNDMLSDGTVCCFLSHQRCWQALVDSGEAYAAIFEDDVVFSATARPVLADTSWLPPNFDIVRLETYLRDTIVEKQAVTEIHGHALRRLMADHVGAAGYIISRHCARMLLERSRTFSVPVDHFMFRDGKGPFAEMSVLQMFPAICIQQQFLSKQAPASQIVPDAKVKLSAAEKLKRELLRPARKSARGVRAMAMNMFSGQIWGKVPFQP